MYTVHDLRLIGKLVYSVLHIRVNCTFLLGVTAELGAKKEY